MFFIMSSTGINLSLKHFILHMPFLQEEGSIVSKPAKKSLFLSIYNQKLQSPSEIFILVVLIKFALKKKPNKRALI